MNTINQNKIIVKLNLFKGFSRFILDHCLNDFSQYIIKLDKEKYLTLFKNFGSKPEKELFTNTRESLLKFLNSIVKGTVYEESLESIHLYLSGYLDLDFTILEGRGFSLFYLNRKLALFSLLTSYTQDPDTIVKLVTEIENLFTEIENAAHLTFAEIRTKEFKAQSEELTIANKQLKESKEELRVTIEKLQICTSEIEASNKGLQELLEKLADAQSTIYDNENRLLEAQAIAHLGSWEWLLANDHVLWSAEMKKIFGYSESFKTVNYRTFLKHIHPDDREKVKKNIQKSIQHKEDYSHDYRIITKDGKVKWLQSRGKLVFENLGLIKITGTAYDITYHKEIEEALKISRDYYLTILNDFPALVWRCNTEGKCNYFNETWLTWTGRGLEDEYGDGWIQGLHPEDAEECISTFKKALKAREPFAMEYRLKKFNDSYGWLLDIAKPIYGLNGEFIGFIGSCFDITEDKKMKKELTSAYKKLKQTNKELVSAEQSLRDLNYNLEKIVEQRTKELKESALRLKIKNDRLVQMNEYLDNFVYAAAHDLKSPVVNLQLLTSLFKKAKDDLQRDAYIDIMLQLVTRLGNTLDGLVQIIEIQSNLHEVVKLVKFHEILDIVMNDLKAPIDEEAIKITSNFSECPQIYYFEPFLQSIIRNLVSNAIKYSSENKESYLSLSTYKENGFIVLKAEDNGIGIDLVRYQKTLFKPFNRFTKKSEGKGIGLHLIKNMTEKNGGKISVESEVGKGTTFSIYLKEYKNP